MPKTIRELADELKVSKQTIQYHYQKLPAKNHQKNSHGVNLISPTAERIIRGKVTKVLLAKKQQTSDKEPPKTSKENNELITTLRREVEDLKSQRDKQLATKDQQIDRLTKLVDQQQQLELVTVTENRELKDKVKRLSKPVEASDQAKQLRLNNKKESVQTDSTSIRENNKNRSKRWWQIWK